MKKIIDVLLSIFLSFLLVILHIAFLNILPSPLNALNTIFSIIVLLIIVTNSGKVVWISFFVYFLLDIYSSTPFGTNLFAGTLTTLVIYWFHKDIFTNQSLLSTFVITAAGLVVFRLMYTCINLFYKDFLWSDLFIAYGWEIVCTVIVALILHTLFFIISKKMRPSFIK
ncbi:MAG TPA: hypothetical protein DCS29_04430 [Candidatus Magasanikbacteria bacterium]|nr:MAG: hypothetical protein A2479_03485 [Candidatus Magasanikbacteria bacterium RIFOXYC2_FULL_39_8]HAT03988.1 hypothetical protein [Candidatus Magasanikbacteria bacterium]